MASVGIRLPTSVRLACMEQPSAPLAMGIDCGIGFTGLAIVQGPVEAPVMLYGQCIVTRPAKGTADRKSFDDTRRLSTIAQVLETITQEFRPVCCGVEFYMPYPGRGQAGWKVGMCYGMALGLCKAARVPLYAQLPIDVKYGVAGVKTASKGDIIARIEQAMPSMRAFLHQTTPSRHEHIADAAGHALLALRSHLDGIAPHS